MGPSMDFRFVIVDCDRDCGCESSSLHEAFQPLASAWMAQFAQRFGFDLPDALSGNREFLPDFL